jgi:hypothetical protein
VAQLFSERFRFPIDLLNILRSIAVLKYIIRLTSMEEAMNSDEEWEPLSPFSAVMVSEWANFNAMFLESH